MYTFKSKVRYSETDMEGKLSLPGIVDYFQDVSTFQSESLGRGIEYLTKRRRLWVLSAWQIVIEEYPLLGEEITAGTFPYDFKSFMGMRNFFLEDAKGRMIVKANSIWTLLDMERGIPVKPSADITDAYELTPRLDMEYAPRKILYTGEGKEQETFLVAKQHLDSNHHVNNGQYVSMAMDCLPTDYRIRQMRAEYKKQAYLHDKIVPLVYTEEARIIVALCDETKDPYAVIEFT